MTQFTLSSDTQVLINIAVNSGPGDQNVNYFNAYNAIHADLQAEQASGHSINPGVMNWFSQAGLVNTFTFSPNATGLFIYSYTQGAAAAFGVNVTYAQLQSSSNAIGLSVFKSLQASNFLFSDTGNFSMPNIAKHDAGSGIGDLQSLFPQAHLDFSIWGGTLFARTVLDDPTYFSDYNINLTPGQQDCEAIEQGLVTALAKEAAGGYFSGLPTSIHLDFPTIAACIRLQGSIDGQTQFASALGGGTVGFALKDAQLISALGAINYTPQKTAVVNADWRNVATDFEGYLAPSAGETWNSAAAGYGVSGSQLGELNGVSVNGTEAIAPGVILVPFSTITVNGSQSISGSTADNYAYDLATHAYYVTGESLTDASQGALTLFDAAGNSSIVGPGLATSLAESGSGVTVNLSAGGVSYSLSLASGNSGSLGFGSSGDISVLVGDLASIVLGNGGLSLSAAGATDLVSSNATGTSASITGNNLVATLTGSRDTLDVTGISDVVKATGGTIALEAGSTADVNGNGDTVDLATGSEVGLSGTNDVANGAAGTVALAPGAAADVNGSGNTVDLATGSEVGLSGTNDVVNGAGSTVALAPGATADVNGNGNNVDLATGSEVGLSGINDVVNGAAGTVVLAANATADVNGNGDVVDLATGSEAGLSGINDVVNGAAGTVVLAANATADVNGNGDVVDLATGSEAGLSGINERGRIGDASPGIARKPGRVCGVRTKAPIPRCGSRYERATPFRATSWHDLRRRRPSLEPLPRRRLHRRVRLTGGPGLAPGRRLVS